MHFTVSCVLRQPQDSVSWQQCCNEGNGSLHEVGWTEGKTNSFMKSVVLLVACTKKESEMFYLILMIVGVFKDLVYSWFTDD